MNWQNGEEKNEKIMMFQKGGRHEKNNYVFDVFNIDDSKFFSKYL